MDYAVVSAISNSEKAVIPALSLGNPDFKVDNRVRSGFGDRHYPAECGCLKRIAGIWEGEFPRKDLCAGRDGHVWNVELDQITATRTGGSMGDEYERCDEEAEISRAQSQKC